MSIGVSIIEDDGPTRQILADWIRSADGFRCVSEHSCAETALAQLPKENPDVVMVDINLPGISGVECVRRLKPLMPNTQFVILTVYEDANHIFSALAAGATGYLLKQTPRSGTCTPVARLCPAASRGRLSNRFTRHDPLPSTLSSFRRASARCWTCLPVVIYTRR